MNLAGRSTMYLQQNYICQSIKFGQFSNIFIWNNKNQTFTLPDCRFQEQVVERLRPFLPASYIDWEILKLSFEPLHFNSQSSQNTENRVSDPFPLKVDSIPVSDFFLICPCQATFDKLLYIKFPYFIVIKLKATRPPDKTTRSPSLC